MKDIQKPLVSVPVITYNSSKTVVETLNSIYNQSYPNLELIVSDDGSPDNTIQVCREWIEAHKDRFVRAELLTVEKNTGISANFNRAYDACQGEWVKGIAGDDLLLPDCVSDYVQFVEEHPEAIYVFGRMAFFGASEADCSCLERVFDYSFFDLSPDEQLHELVFEGNHIPAATLFFNLRKAKELHLNRYDERIPLLEDWPHWITLLQNGIKLFLMDREVVCYRVGGGVSTASRISVASYRSLVLFDLLYRYPLWMKENEEQGLARMADMVCEQYRLSMQYEKEVERIRRSLAYRLGKALLKPFSWMRRKVSK